MGFFPYYQELLDDVKNGFVATVKHPTLDLHIYDYTAKTQYSGAWTECRTHARGLILDGAGNVVSRPFKKFFNLSDYKTMPKEMIGRRFDAYDKLDGTLIITYQYQGQFGLATRLRFESPHVNLAHEIWYRKHFDQLGLRPDRTYLFEMVGPSNRIVVKYPEDDLICLGALDTHTGRFYSRPFHDPPQLMSYWDLDLHYAERFESTDISLLPVRDNAEGFVLFFPETNFRVKLKYDEYIRLHRLATQVNTKVIWELLAEGKSLDELLESTQDELYTWVQEQVDGFLNDFAEIWREVAEILRVKEVNNLSRKELALTYKGSKVSGVVFAMIDDKPDLAHQRAWKLLEPRQAQFPPHSINPAALINNSVGA